MYFYIPDISSSLSFYQETNWRLWCRR